MSRQHAMRTYRRSLPMQLLRAREAVMKQFLPSLRADGLSAAQWRVIRALAEDNGLDMSAIAERCFLLMPSLSRIVQHLEARELIERKSGKRDLRRSVIYLTPAGIALFEKIAPVSEERYAHLTETFGYGKLELLYELLDELVEKVGRQSG